MHMEAAERTVSATAGFDGAERRSDQRHRTLKGGTLYFNKGYSSLECVIRDLSETGARIQMGETFGVPSRFTMSISGEETRVEASLRWRNSRSIGLSFPPRPN
jgi:PilZ domain